MQKTRVNPLRRLLLGLMFAASLTPTVLGSASVAYADGSGSLSISPDSGAVGSRFHLQGTGFQNFSLITHDLDVTIFDASGGRAATRPTPSAFCATSARSRPCHWPTP